MRIFCSIALLAAACISSPASAASLLDYVGQCVPFARAASGIQIYGDAWTWWRQADGRYQRTHAPKVGSVIVFATLPSGERYGFIGDLTWQLDGVTERLERPLIMRMLADSDAKQVRRDLARVIALAAVIRMIPAHDLRAYEGIPLLGSSDAHGGNR